MRYVSSLVFLTFIFISCPVQGAIHHLEPSSWWQGMQLNELQIMVHGDNIASLEPRIAKKGIVLNNVIRVENPNYLFLEVSISPEAAIGTYEIQLRKGRKVVERCDFELHQRERAAEDYVGFNSSDVIYLVTPDRFANGNPDNDAVDGMKEKPDRAFHGGRHGGDLAGMQQHLDYIDEMGFTAIWINPVLENDMKEYSYHGYSTTDFYKVDPRYGSNEEYKALVKSARGKGMKVIMDMIANHCGTGHWWMDDLPSKDWFNQWETYTQTSHRKTTLVDPYASQRDKDVYLKGWFVKTMPDLNQENELMANYLIQNSIWWVEYLGLSGIRMDTYSYSDRTFLSNWTRAVMTEYPNFNIVGEEWYAEPTLVSYWQKDKKNHDGYTSDLKSLCDFPMVFTVVEALNRKETFAEGLIQIYETLAHDYLYAHPEDLLTFPDNHDMSRIYTQLNEDYELYKMALGFYATTRGIPMMYYGTEILMSNPNSDKHGEIRSDFPGGWSGDEVNAFTGAGLSEQQLEAQKYVKTLLNWRKTSQAVIEGKLTHFEPKKGIYVYFRHTDTEKVMVVMNKNEKETALDLEVYREMLQGVSSATHVLDGQNVDLTQGLSAPAKSISILQLH